MTKIYKTVEESRHVKKLESRTCDWCNENMAEDYGKEYNNTRNMQLYVLKGLDDGYDAVYEEGWRIDDLCDPCLEKLVQLFKEKGIKMRYITSIWDTCS